MSFPFDPLTAPPGGQPSTAVLRARTLPSSLVQPQGAATSTDDKAPIPAQPQAAPGGQVQQDPPKVSWFSRLTAVSRLNMTQRQQMMFALAAFLLLVAFAVFAGRILLAS